MPRHSTSMLPTQARALLAELAMVEEEITRLEKKIKTLKMSLNRENKHNRMHLSDQNFEGFSCQSAERVNNASSTTSSSEDDAAASRILGWKSRHQSYPNPNELSQDLIRSLVTIFMRLDKPETDAASNPDPYCLFSDSDGPARDIGPYKNSIQITKCSLEESHASACLPTFESVRVLMLKLCAVNLICLTYEQRLAFWMNIYNACIMHAFLKHGLPSTQEKLLALMNKAVVNVGGIVLNALAIEHFILRHPVDSSPGFMEAKETLLRHACGLERPEPNVTFALCRGCHSSPGSCGGSDGEEDDPPAQAAAVAHPGFWGRRGIAGGMDLGAAAALGVAVEKHGGVPGTG